MGKYRTKVFPVEAWQFHPQELPWPPGVISDAFHPMGPIYVETMDGPQHIVRGDWVVRWPDRQIDLYHEFEFFDDFEKLPDSPKPEAKKPEPPVKPKKAPKPQPPKAGK